MWGGFFLFLLFSIFLFLLRLALSLSTWSILANVPVDKEKKAFFLCLGKMFCKYPFSAFHL